jgi:hypothetical protein
MRGLAFVVRLLYALSRRDGGGDISIDLPDDGEGERLSCFDLGGLDGDDIIASTARSCKFAWQGDNGEVGEFRSGELESGDEMIGV